jgi:hypothetical protein
VIKGLRVEVSERGRIERSHTSFLDADEVADLAKAVTVMGDTYAKWTAEPPADKYVSGGVSLPAPYREFTFSTKGDFRLAIFQRAKEQGVVIQSGSIGSATVSITPLDLPKLKAIVDLAAAAVKAL